MKYAHMLGVAEHEFRLVFGTSKIAYDEEKDELNRRKHHYALESAVLLLERLLMSPWVGRPHAIREVVKSGEVRHEHLCTGDAGEVLLMVTTMRADETVRIISLRRASAEEREVFQKLTGYIGTD